MIPLKELVLLNFIEYLDNLMLFFERRDWH
jgi:hypothetical protein